MLEGMLKTPVTSPTQLAKSIVLTPVLATTSFGIVDGRTQI